MLVMEGHHPKYALKMFKMNHIWSHQGVKKQSINVYIYIYIETKSWTLDHGIVEGKREEV